MSMSDTLADMLAQIKNGQMASKINIVLPYSKLKMDVLNVLKNEGFIEDYNEDDSNDSFKQINIKLKYFNGTPVINYIKKISKPGRRIYSKIKNLPKLYNGLGVIILATSRGILSDHEARIKNIGGEVLLHVF